jgi:hypothetical protein
MVVEEIYALDATRAKVARRWALRELPASEQGLQGGRVLDCVHALIWCKQQSTTKQMKNKCHATF